ncbi:MAG: hypothetical protein RL695_1096 [Pseudomonadota bacterium]
MAEAESPLKFGLEIDIRKNLHAGARHFELAVQLRSTSRRMVIFGPSGAGKSLTLKAVAGLLQPDSGHIRLDGVILYDQAQGISLTPQTRRVGYLFQDYALFPHLTVRQNIASALIGGWRNPPKDFRHAEVDYWLSAFHLDVLANQYPDQLSGGQRQRTALARALVAHPRALLLDEPFAALDPALRVSMRAELDELQRRLDVPMILITHDVEDVAVFGEQVVHMAAGKIVDGHERA